MNLKLTVVVLSFGLTLPAGAGFTSAGLTVSGISQVGNAGNVATNPTGYTSVAGSNSDSQNGETGGTYLDPSAVTSAIQVGVISFDQRRANTYTAAIGDSFNAGDTFSASGSTSANVITRDNTANQYKGTATASVSFVGELVATDTTPGVAISFDGDYSLFAFAQNNAPPTTFNVNSAYSSVQATLKLENVTAGTTAGEVEFINEMISQIYCGPRGDCIPASINDTVSGTAFIPLSGQSEGDILRMSIDIFMMTDTYAKGFTDTLGQSQTAGGMGRAGFENLDITLLLIPEPGSLALVLVGVASIAAARHRLYRTSV